jgi:microsomal epoxide hydrolase
MLLTSNLVTMPSMAMMALGPGIELATPEEKVQIEKAAKWRQSGMAYAFEHGTRPATIGFMLSSSPLAMLVWYVHTLLPSMF